MIKDNAGKVVELRCTYDPGTRSGAANGGRKVKGTLHWVSAEHAINAEVRLYDRLFNTANPAAEPDFHRCLNPDSLEKLTECKLEPGLAEAKPGERFQFERNGYFCVDTEDAKPGAPVFNRIVPLRDSWAKIEKAES